METLKIFKTKDELPQGTKIIDAVDGSLRELLTIRNPHLKSSSEEEKDKAFIEFQKNLNIETVYAYYPWKNVAVHLPQEEVYLELRTARNKNIITKKEQDEYRSLTVGIVGLSVGLNVLSALVFSGGPKKLKIADYDIIEISNLNRLRAPIFEVGTNKTDFAAQEVWGLDPFAQLDLWKDGVDKKQLKEFITSEPKLDVFIDEMDSLDLKLLSRVICREQKIPVIMVTDNGDNVILDIERFDEEPDREILHGLVKDVDIDAIANLPYPEWVKIATKIVDPKNLTADVQKSIKEIGKTIAAVPQLGTTATIAGCTAAYIVRKIATGAHVPSGRYFFNLDEIL